MGSNIYILWKESAIQYGSGSLFLVKSTDYGHAFDSKKELAGETKESNIASYANYVYVVFASSRGVFLIKSTDWGNSFGSPVKLNQLIDVSSDNKVYLLWMQQALRNPNDVNYIFERSINEGTSFSCLTKLKSSGLAMDTQLISTDARTFIFWRDYVKLTSDVLFTATPP